jgi:Superfamily I DNA and RNA helicases
VYVDEAQDLTPAQIELTALAAGPATRHYYVGDPRQAIYLFRGADSNAVDNIIKRMGCGRMPLSVCYRCSKAVVRRAQQKAPEIEYADNSPEGTDQEISTSDFRNQVGDGDFVLCRTTAPLVSECLRAIRQGRKATVRGREIGESLIGFIDGVGHAGDDIEGFLADLTIFVSERQDALSRTGREDALILLADQAATIRVLAEDAKTVAGIKAKIEAIFADDQKSGIMFMSIHKSKGLEAPRVFILRPDQLPHKLAKTSEQLVAEDNLWFVAVTRCKLNLFWVQPETTSREID